MERLERMDSVIDALPLGKDVQSARRRIEAMEKLLERAFVIPVINRPVGFDALAGLIPVAGDAVAALMGLYLVWEARNLGLPKWKLARMIGNVGFDALLGAVPVAGDLFDFLYRSNSRNLAIVRRHLDRHHPATALVES